MKMVGSERALITLLAKYLATKKLSTYKGRGRIRICPDLCTTYQLERLKIVIPLNVHSALVLRVGIKQGYSSQ